MDEPLKMFLRSSRVLEAVRRSQGDDLLSSSERMRFLAPRILDHLGDAYDHELSEYPDRTEIDVFKKDNPGGSYSTLVNRDDDDFLSLTHAVRDPATGAGSSSEPRDYELRHPDLHTHLAGLIRGHLQ